ncbi:MAG: DoxX family protein [Deltaproteobacteria bacterium]|nr:DoxX family protein [Deltaproteobacteria bacterium]MCW5808781.1 DoxX family protein [Deltaproteobacteria bacterium]
MRILHVARILLGLGFVVFATNYFLPFLPAQDPPPAEALPFIGAFATSGFLTLVKVIELGAGLLLLSNRFVPLALALLAPIIVGITGFHVLLAPAGTPIAIVFLVLELVLAWGYRRAFAPMLRARVAADGLTAQALGPVDGEQAIAGRHVAAR